MSQVSRTASKTKFVTGATPTQQDFYDLHESVRWFDEQPPDVLFTALSTLVYDYNSGQAKTLLMDANKAITTSNTVTGKTKALLMVTQDATGGRTLSINGTALSIGPAANQKTFITIIDDGSGLVYTVNTALVYGSGGGGGGGGTTLSAPVLATPTVVGSSEIDINWGSPNSNAANMELQRSPDNSTWTDVSTTILNTSTSYNNTGLTASTLYYYRSRWLGDGVSFITSAWSNTVNATTGAGTWSYSQNFDGVTPPAMPSGWVTTGAITVAYGAAVSTPNCLQMPGSGSAVNTAMYNSLDGGSGNVKVSIDIKVVTSDPHEFILLGRASTTSWGTMSAYGIKIWINNGTSATNGVEILKGVSGTFNQLGTGHVGDSSTFAQNIWYKFTLEMTSGNVINVTVQRLSDSMYLNSSNAWVSGLTVALTYTDGSALTGAGYSGLASFIVNPNANIEDNFFITS